MVGKRPGGLVAFGGGLPLYDDKGKLLGAVGVSGDTAMPKRPGALESPGSSRSFPAACAFSSSSLALTSLVWPSRTILVSEIGRAHV